MRPRLEIYCLNVVFFTYLFCVSISGGEGNASPPIDVGQVTIEESSVVAQVGQCRIISFTVNPASAYVGDVFTFSWETNLTKGVDLEPNLGQDLPPTGSLTVVLNGSNWFTLIARGPGGPVEQRLWVDALWPGGTTWWKEFGDSFNLSRSPFPGPRTGTQKWQLSFRDEIVSPPLIMNDASTLIKTAETEYCYNNDGLMKWSHQVPLGLLPTMMTDQNGVIYLVDDQNLVALNANGKLGWQTSITTYNYLNYPYLTLLPGNVIVLGGNYQSGFCFPHDIGVTYLFSSNGTLMYGIGHMYTFLPPAVHIDNSFIFNGPHLFCQTFGGDLVWGLSYDCYYGIPTTHVTGTTYCACSCYNRTFKGVQAIDGAGNILWTQTDFKDIRSFRKHPPASGLHGHLYFVAQSLWDDNYYLYSLNPSGGIRWQYLLLPEDKYSTSIAIDADETIYVLLPSRLIAVNGDKQFLWEYPLQPDDQNRCCLSMDGTLYVTNKYSLLAFHD